MAEKVGNISFVKFREDFVAVTKDVYEAIILQELYQIQRNVDYYLGYEEEVLFERPENPKMGWFYIKAKNVKNQTKLPISLKTIRKKLKNLEQKEFIMTRKATWMDEISNPSRKKLYRIDLKKLTQKIKNKGFD